MAIILIDFDGTCTTHEFPNIGKDVGAVPVLKDLVNEGHKLILWTVRSNVKNPKSNIKGIIEQSGNFLDDAVEWFKQNDIPLFGVNENPDQKSFSSSPKAYGNFLIDDTAIGVPLVYVNSYSDRPFVDWIRIREILEKMKLLTYGRI